MTMTTTRSEKLEIKLTPDEKQKVRKLAKNHSLDMASFARVKIFTGGLNE